MADYENMRLCGGTFLVLLLEAKGQRRNSRMGEGRSSDGKSNPEVFSNLVLTVNPKFQIPSGRSFNTFTSDYKLCRSSDSSSAGLTNELLISQFDNDIKTKYYECLELFHGRLERVIDFEVKGPWLVAALIDLIEADNTISDDTLFYVRPYGHTVKKADMRNMECICISSFIFGVWHYIITQVRDNTVGTDTIRFLLEDKTGSRAERKFVLGIGMKTVTSIKTSVEIPKHELQYAPSTPINEEHIGTLFSPENPVTNRSISKSKKFEILSKGDPKPFLDFISHESMSNAAPFYTYLRKSTDFYSMVKTLLYSESPRKFKDFYVPNDLGAKVSGCGNYRKILDKPIVDIIGNPFKDIIIRGTGGIGKSMMLRHIFLHFAENYNNYHLLPVFVSLKNFTGEEPNLEHFIFTSIKEFDHSIEFQDFEKTLNDSGCLILLDGLDEIPTSARFDFDNFLVNFKKAYTGNIMVISSRPTSSFIQFGHFEVWEIQPFSKDKALELIDKLDYYDIEAKSKFRKDLDKKLYRTHHQFASNPLLLTIMLMTYTSYGEVPAKRHVFYAKAYETMARLHDATKGAYVRPMHTGLSPEDFAIYLSDFCARTYGEEVLEFTELTFTKFMSKVIEHRLPKIKSTSHDFLLDLINNLCIMYEEGEKYYFIHRSFQEYFSAVFFSSQMDDRLKEIGDFFEHQKRRMSDDLTFAMLYDMIPKRIDRYVFLPLLKALWKKCDEADGYWTFLETLYPTVFAYEGEPGEYMENDPESYLYNYIARPIFPKIFLLLNSSFAN